MFSRGLLPVSRAASIMACLLHGGFYFAFADKDTHFFWHSDHIARKSGSLQFFSFQITTFSPPKARLRGAKLMACPPVSWSCWFLNTHYLLLNKLSEMTKLYVSSNSPFFSNIFITSSRPSKRTDPVSASNLKKGMHLLNLFLPLLYVDFKYN